MQEPKIKLSNVDETIKDINTFITTLRNPPIIKGLRKKNVKPELPEFKTSNYKFNTQLKPEKVTAEYTNFSNLPKDREVYEYKTDIQDRNNNFDLDIEETEETKEQKKYKTLKQSMIEKIQQTELFSEDCFSIIKNIDLNKIFLKEEEIRVLYDKLNTVLTEHNNKLTGGRDFTELEKNTNNLLQTVNTMKKYIIDKNKEESYFNSNVSIRQIVESQKYILDQEYLDKYLKLFKNNLYTTLTPRYIYIKFFKEQYNLLQVKEKNFLYSKEPDYKKYDKIFNKMIDFIINIKDENSYIDITDCNLGFLLLILNKILFN